MDYNFLTTKPDQISSSNADIPAEDSHDGGQVCAGLSRNRKEAMAQCNGGSPGGLLPNGGNPPLFSEPTEVYTETHASSIQTRALAGTLEAVRVLRDEMLCEDEYSASSLLLAQLTFILERIEHGIPSGREAFLAVLRAAKLPKRVSKAAEVSV